MHECIYVRKRFGQQIRLSSLGFREFTSGCRSVITYGKDSAGKVTVSLAGRLLFSVLSSSHAAAATERHDAGKFEKWGADEYDGTGNT